MIQMSLLSLMGVSSDSEDEPMFTEDEREGRRVLGQQFIEQCTRLRQLQEAREARAMQRNEEEEEEEDDEVDEDEDEDEEEEDLNRLPIDSDMIRRQTEADIHRQAVQEVQAWRGVRNVLIQATEAAADLAIVMDEIIAASRARDEARERAREIAASAPDLPESSDAENDEEM